MKYLLDTHVVVAWVLDPRRLTTRQRKLLDSVSAASPVYVSDISLWEIAMLHDLGRIRLDIPLREWLTQATARPFVETLRISPAVAAEVATLPATMHRDTADRILVATARIHGATLVTRDRLLLDADLVPTLG